jgi:hypothetical protein
LIGHPTVARQYEVLKKGLAASHPNDRLDYTTGKTEFILRIMAWAKQKAEPGTCTGRRDSASQLYRASLVRRQ